MNPELKNIFIMVALTVIAVGVLGFFGYVVFLLQQTTDTAIDVQTDTRLRSYQSAATGYYNKLLSYKGLCSAIGVTPEFQCRETETMFRIVTRTSNGYSCADATGFRGAIERLPAELVCQ